MALQELYSEYKPEGLVGGMVSGLNTGANLGSMFAQTNATNQQTSSREQKLPWELAGLAADADTKVQANDLTRATQPGQIEATNATNKTALMTQQQIQELLPFDTFNKMITQQTQQSAGILTQAAERLEAGDKSVWQELSAMATTPEAKKVFQETYAKFGKLPPAVAAQEARKWADKLLADLDNLNQETRFKKWQETLKATVDKYQANAAASAGSNKQPNYNVEFVNILARRIKEQNPKWTAAQVQAEAVRQYKTTVESTPIGNLTMETTKSMAPTPGASPMLPKAPTASGWVKGPDGVMRKQ